MNSNERKEGLNKDDHSLRVNDVLRVDDIVVSRSDELTAKNSISSVVRQGNNVLLGTLVFYDEGSEMMDVSFLDKYAADNRIPGGFLKQESRKPLKTRILISRIIDRSFRPIVKRKGFQIIIRLLNNDRSLNKTRAAILLAADLLLQAGLIDQLTYPYFREWNDGHFLCINFYKRRISMIEGSLDLIKRSELKEIFKSAFELSDSFHDGLRNEVTFGNSKERHIEKLKKSSFKGDALREFINLCRRIWNPRTNLNQLKNEINRLLNSYETDHPHGNYEYGLRTIFEMFYRNFGRYDGRKDKDVRDLGLVTFPLKNPHSSALFSRGGTKVLSSLIASEEPQTIDEGSTRSYKEYLNVQYDMLGHAVNSVTRIGMHTRREVGHGNLVYSGLKSTRNESQDRPALFIQNDVIDCDGSSSMASLTASSVAMNLCDQSDILVVGVTVGCITPGRLILDITGLEDWMGLMDFKICGNGESITGIQLDLKYFMIGYEDLERIIDLGIEGIVRIGNFVKPLVDSVERRRIDLQPNQMTMKVKETDMAHLIGYTGFNFKEIQGKYDIKLDLDKNKGVLRISGENQNEVSESYTLLQDRLRTPSKNERYGARVMNQVRPKVYLVQPYKARTGFLSTDERLDNQQDIIVELRDIERDRISYNLVRE